MARQVEEDRQDGAREQGFEGNRKNMRSISDMPSVVCDTLLKVDVEKALKRGLGF